MFARGYKLDSEQLSELSGARKSLDPFEGCWGCGRARCIGVHLCAVVQLLPVSAIWTAHESSDAGAFSGPLTEVEVEPENLHFQHAVSAAQPCLLPDGLANSVPSSAHWLCCGSLKGRVTAKFLSEGLFFFVAAGF